MKKLTLLLNSFLLIYFLSSSIEIAAQCPGPTEDPSALWSELEAGICSTSGCFHDLSIVVKPKDASSFELLKWVESGEDDTIEIEEDEYDGLALIGLCRTMVPAMNESDPVLGSFCQAIFECTKDINYYTLPTEYRDTSFMLTFTSIDPAEGPIKLEVKIKKGKTKFGTLNDVSFSAGNGDLIDSPLPGQSVNLMDLNENVIESTTTNGNGEFLFEADPEGSYILYYEKDNLAIKTPVSPGNESCPTSACKLRLPITLTQQIANLIDVHYQTINATFTLPAGSSIQLPGPPLGGANALLNKSEPFGEDFNAEIEGLGRFYIVQDGLKKYIDQSVPINDILCKNTSDLFWWAFGFAQVVNAVTKYYERCSACRSLFNFSGNWLDDSITRIILDYLQRADIDARGLGDFINQLILGGIKLNLKSDLAEEFINPTITEFYLSDEFIQGSVGSGLDKAAAEASNFPAENGFANAYLNAKEIVTQSQEKSAAKTESARFLNSSAGTAGDAEAFTSAASAISLLVPGGASVAPALKALAYLFKATEFSLYVASGAVAKGRYNGLREETNQFPDIILQNRGMHGPNTFTVNIDSLIGVVELKVQAYNAKIQEVATAIEQDEVSTAVIDFQALITQDDELDQAIREASRPLLAIQKNRANDIDPVSFMDSLQNTLFISQNQRLGADFMFLAYINDTTDVDIAAEYESFATDVIASNNSIAEELRKSYTQYEGYTSVPLIGISGGEYIDSLFLDEERSFSYRVKNYGNVEDSNVVARYAATGPIQFQADSIFIGTVQAGQEIEISATISTSVLQDTFATYVIDFSGDNIRSLFESKSLIIAEQPNAVRDVPSKHQSNYVFESFPNPSRGNISIKIPENSGFIPVQIQILNAEGKVLRSFLEWDSQATSIIELDLTDLPSGLYFVSLLDKSGRSGLSKIYVE